MLQIRAALSLPDYFRTIPKQIWASPEAWQSFMGKLATHGWAAQVYEKRCGS